MPCGSFGGGSFVGGILSIVPTGGSGGQEPPPATPDPGQITIPPDAVPYSTQPIMLPIQQTIGRLSQVILQPPQNAIGSGSQTLSRVTSQIVGQLTLRLSQLRTQLVQLTAVIHDWSLTYRIPLPPRVAQVVQQVYPGYSGPNGYGPAPVVPSNPPGVPYSPSGPDPSAVPPPGWTGGAAGQWPAPKPAAVRTGSISGGDEVTTPAPAPDDTANAPPEPPADQLPDNAQVDDQHDDEPEPPTPPEPKPCGCSCAVEAAALVIQTLVPQLLSSISRNLGIAVGPTTQTIILNETMTPPAAAALAPAEKDNLLTIDQIARMLPGLDPDAFPPLPPAPPVAGATRATPKGGEPIPDPLPPLGAIPLEDYSADPPLFP